MYLRESVRALYFSGPEQRYNRLSMNHHSLESRLIVSFLGPTLLHLTLPKAFNLESFEYDTFEQLVNLDAVFHSSKPPSSPKSRYHVYTQSEDEESSHGEDLDHELYEEDYVSRHDINLRNQLPLSIRLSTLTLSTKRPSSEFLNIISSVGSTLINLSLYFLHPINYKEGVEAFSTTFSTLRRFRYHYYSAVGTPSRLLESILPKFRQLEVFSIYSDNIPRNLLVTLPVSVKHLEIEEDEGDDLNLSKFIEPLRNSSSRDKLSSLKKLVIADEKIKLDY